MVFLFLAGKPIWERTDMKAAPTRLLHNSIPLQFAAKSIFCVISLKSALNVQQAHLRRISVFCLEAVFFAKFRLKLSYATASYECPDGYCVHNNFFCFHFWSNLI
jgi:hypothetical protein